MDLKNKHPEFLAVEQHIRRERLERVVGVADAITEFVMDCWQAIQQPPPPPAIIIDRRRETRGEAARSFGRFAHR
jgi:hypothetical protein